jgi:hypothetical protein
MNAIVQKYGPLAIAALAGSIVTQAVMLVSLNKAIKKDVEMTNKIIQFASEMSYDIGVMNGKAEAKREAAAVQN